MKYFIIAGERSGDLHASRLIQQLITQDPDAKISAWGGDMMKRAGATLLQHYMGISFMGLWEVIKNLRAISQKLKECQHQVKEFDPDVLILVDFPGFNLRMARYAKSIQIKTAYYISPKLWAWKKGRIRQVRAYVDQMLVILPFEEDFYNEMNYPVTYVGNPLVEIIDSYEYDQDLLTAIREQKKTAVAFLPGSRIQEVEKSINIIQKLSKEMPDYQWLVAGVDNLPEQVYDPLKELKNVSIYFDRTYELLKVADVAIITSGTATLEAAIIGTKQVVIYRTSWLTYEIGRRLVNIDFISLVNLIAEREVIKELIQGAYNIPMIKEEINRLLNDRQRRRAVESGYEEVRMKLGSESASKNAATSIIKLISST